MKSTRLIINCIGVLAILCISVLPASAQNGFVWDSFKPEKAPKAVKTLITGKKLNYYPLAKGDEILITVEGPTQIRVLTRVEFGSDLGGEKSYYLRYEREDGKKGKYRRVATAAATAMLADKSGIHLGASRSVYLKVPAGKHTYRFYVGSKSTYRLYLRFYERTVSVQTKAENIAFTPAKFTTEVPVIVNEEQVSYYRAGHQDSLRLSLIGPTSVKVLARLEYDASMFSNQKFRVRVMEDGVEKHIYPLRSEPSQAAKYVQVMDTVLGKGAKFYIEVPKGKHDYEFEIIDNGRNVLMRFFVPTKDMKNNL